MPLRHGREELGRNPRVSLAAPPSSVTLVWSGKSYAQDLGKQLKFTCISHRSRPAAKLRWYKDTQEVTSEMTGVSTESFADGRTTQCMRHDCEHQLLLSGKIENLV